jgi:FMN reductase (NADPH)
MTTNPTLDLLHRHGSVRTYLADPVSPAMVEQIVHAAQRASTSSNLQVVSVVAVADSATRSRLSEISGQTHVAQAPVVLVWCADLRRLDRACRLRGRTQVTDYVENFLTCVLDAGIAAQNAAVAAESFGLGVCYLGSIRNDVRAVIELLALPRLVFPVVGMALGWPAVPPASRPRLAVSAVLSWDRYAETSDAALLEYDRTMAATDVYQRRQVPVPGKPGQLEAYGWLEHCARRAEQPLRTELRAALKQQGFGLE